MQPRSAALAALLAGGPALAQMAPAPAPAPAPAAGPAGVADIVVTAQRRSEAAQDVPIALTVLDAAMLTARGAQTPLAAVQVVPNLFAVHNTGLGSANSYYLRGLGSVETIATFDPAVGTTVDDIYLARQNANDFGFFDIERLEVLRGPQGTLFGRNTTGGIVNVILKRPAERLGGYLEFAAGRFGRRLLRGSIDLPVSADLRVKLSGYYQNDDGWARNTTTGERVNDGDMAGLRGAVEWRIAPTLSWHVAAAYMRNDAENLLNFTCDPNRPANCNGRFVSTGLSTRENLLASPYAGTIDVASGRPLAPAGAKAGFPLGNRTDTQLYTSRLEWAAGEGLALALISGFVDTRQRYALDFLDGRPLPSLAAPVPAPARLGIGGYTLLNDGTHRQISQELKADGRLLGGLIDYVAGLYWLRETNATDVADLLGPNLLLADRIIRNNTTARAVYGQADLNVTGTLKLTAGIRYTDEAKTFGVGDNRPGCTACLSDAALLAAGVPLAQRAREWTPRFAVAWRPTDHALVFASATRGFKSGGWNARALTAAQALPFGPETVWSHEAGVKTDWFDRRLRVNLTGFWLDVQGLQVPTAYAANGQVAFLTRNAADWRNRGLELEVTAQPVDGLSLYANLGWQRDRYKVPGTLGRDAQGVKTVAQQQVDCRAELASGRLPLAPGADNAPDCAVGIVAADGGIATPVRTPDLTLAVGASYDWPIPAAGISLAPQVNAQYRGALQTLSSNASFFAGSVTGRSGTVYPANPFGRGALIQGSLTPAVWQVQAALQLRTLDGNWLLSVECDNCLDTAWSQSSLFGWGYLAPPRTWAFRMRRQF